MTKIAKNKYDYWYLIDDDYTEEERIMVDEYNAYDHLSGMSDRKHLFSYHVGKLFHTQSLHDHALFTASIPAKCHLD